MATVNKNMFDASVTMHHPHEASLMVLPLNLIVKIIANVCSLSFCACSFLLTEVRNRSRTPETLLEYAEPVGSSTT